MMSDATAWLKSGQQMTRKPLAKCHGGQGTLDWVCVLDQNDLVGRRVNFIHDDVLPPGVSIGPHTHGGDEEYYFIVSGQGTMIVNDERVQVTAGDVTAVFPGGMHGLENTGRDALRVLVFSVAAEVS